MNEQTMQPPGAPNDLSDLALMGSGGENDRLRFRLVVSLLWRCVRLLRPVRGHLVALTIPSLVLYALSFAATGIAFDVFWTRALLGQPLTPEEAALLGWDPKLTVHVPELSQAVRKELILQLSVLGAVMGLLYLPAGLGLYYYFMWILQRVNQVLRVELLDRLQSLSLRFHAENQVGDAIYRIYQDSSMVTQLINVLVLTPVSAAWGFFAGLVAVALFDPTLAGILLLVLPPCLLLGAFVSRRLRIRFRGAREANSRLTSQIQQTLTGIRAIKAYGAEGAEQQRFESRSLDAFHHAYRARSWLATFNVAIFWILGAAFLVAVGIATVKTEQAVPLGVAAFGFTVWNLGMYNFFKSRFGGGTQAVRGIFGTWGRVQDIAIGLDRAFELLDLEPEVTDAPNAVALPPFESSVAFRDVHFAYQPEHPVLAGVDLEARAGTITAIVGPTGSGKSTLLSLLLRLFDPDRGSIEIDGHDLRTLRLESLRQSVAIALQENLLFGETIAENIRFAVPDAPFEAVEAAARVSCADDFIRELPDGYDTLLGERGAKLSTGQRQRLSIARAILKDSPILILDEPSASLDARTELSLMENLATWGQGRAIFLITHRLSTIRLSDQIAVLRDGRIIETGTHDELVTIDGGGYRALAAAHGALAASERA